MLQNKLLNLYWPIFFSSLLAWIACGFGFLYTRLQLQQYSLGSRFPYICTLYQDYTLFAFGIPFVFLFLGILYERKKPPYNVFVGLNYCFAALWASAGVLIWELPKVHA